MSDSARRQAMVFSLAAAAALAPDALLAYGGPGSVVTGLGALLAVLAAVAAAVFGFVWYPVKRLLQTIRGDSDAAEGEELPDAAEGAPPE